MRPWRAVERLCARLAGGGRSGDREAVATESGPYIASARLHVLLMVGLGGFCAIMAWEESDRRRVGELFGYVEKALVVAEAVDAAAWTADGETTESRDAGSLGIRAEWWPPFAAMAGPHARFAARRIERAGTRLATTADSIGECGVEVFAVAALEDAPRTGLALAVMYPSGWETMAERRVSLADAYVVRFGGRCPVLAREADAFLVARYGADGDGYAVVLGEPVHEALGMGWIGFRMASRRSLENVEDRAQARLGRFGPYLSQAQLERLDDRVYPFLQAVDVTYLRNAVVRQAKAMVDRSYGLDEWKAAARTIFDDAADPMGIWGFRLERGVAARAAPLAMLGLCVAFLYRVRRIDPAGDLAAEPWIVAMPRGAVERAGALVWVAMTWVALGCVAWATWVYESGAPAVPLDAMKAFADTGSSGWATVLWLTVTRALVWGAAAETAAAAVLLLGWAHLREVKRRRALLR